MIKMEHKFSKFLGLFMVAFCTFSFAQSANSEKIYLSQNQSKISTQETSKQKLARDILIQLGISKRYDLHFEHMIGALVGSSFNSRLSSRFRKMSVQQAGWNYVEDFYIKRLEVDFSETELKELLNLSKNPLMKKLLQSEIKGYEESSKNRYKLTYKLWENYNSGKINLPSE
jgi:hypothetical protein